MSVVELDISTTPETLFARVAGEDGAFWLDARSADEPTFTSFSPSAQLVVHADGSIATSGAAAASHADPLHEIERFVAAGATGAAPGPVAPHTVGFFAYDLATLVEPRMRPYRDATATLPLAYLARYDAVLELAPQASKEARSPRRLPLRIHARSAGAAARLADAVRRLVATPAPQHPAPGLGTLLEQPSEARHVEMVRRALDYIAAGDVYQVNLAQRFRVRSEASPAEVFLALRARQPVPFGAFLGCEGFVVLSCSPERFLRVAGRMITTEPIKGTRPRDPDPRRDAALRAELARDGKERAEHVMIVDLERNDLGRVCVAGSVHVPSLMRVESFATIHHLVSTVCGRLRDDAGLADVLRATFPGGSISGAPKIRATQIIAELERCPRELYTGAIACFRGVRDFDSSIAIRTAVARDGCYSYYAGGGIVADSDPLREHRECLLKAAPFLAALGVAAAGDAPPVLAAGAERVP